MTQTTIKSEDGRREVVVTEQAGRFTARLYVNGGETATTTTWKGKTLAGAKAFARKVLAR